MIRSNIGNVGVNGMQTLSVIGTTAAGMARANEAQKLNNVMSGRKYLSYKDMETIGKSRAEAQKGAALETLNNKKVEQDGIEAMKDIPDVQIEKTENEEKRVIKVNSPQEEQLNNYINNNLVFSGEFYKQYNTKSGNIILQKRKIKEVEEEDNANV